LLILFVVLVVCIVFVGLDNATGIIIGWMATTSLITVVAHKWRKIWHFLILLAASIAGAIFLAFIYVEVALPLAEWIWGISASESTPWRIFHVIVSNIILLFTPVGIVIGLGGTIWLGISRLVALRHRARPDTT